MPGTTFVINEILNYNFSGTAYSPTPRYIFFGLSTTLVDATGLASVTEPSGADAYARVQYNDFNTVVSPTPFTTSTTGSITNNYAITFPKSTGAWGTILSIFVVDAATLGTGNVLWYKTFATPLVVQANTTLSWDTSHLVISMV